MVNEYTCLANLLPPKYWQDTANNLTADQSSSAISFFATYAGSFGYTTDELNQLKDELYDYIGKNGMFLSNDIWNYKTEDPFSWWTVHGLNKQSKLYLIATKILAIRPSNCDVEKNFSLEKTIHTKTRNRLGDKTVEKLVCVKQHLTNSTRSKKQSEIDFGSECESDSNATVCNREDVPEFEDEDSVYIFEDQLERIDHIEVVEQSEETLQIN